MRERLFANGRWYYTLTIASVGLFAWVPFTHAWTRTEDAGVRRLAAVYGSYAVALGLLSGLTPTNAQGEPDGLVGALMSTVIVVAAIAVAATACIRLTPLRRQVYGLPAPAAPHRSPREAAVADALAARRRRDEARALAARDPNLARELGVGQPEHVGDYDDGGIVDLNTASTRTLVSSLGLDPSGAERLVSGRRQWNLGFTSVDEAIAFVELSERDANILRERGIVLAP